MVQAWLFHRLSLVDTIWCLAIVTSVATVCSCKLEINHRHGDMMQHCDFIYFRLNDGDNFLLHQECMHGHVIDENRDECSAGHISLFISVKCPIASCGLRSELRYAHVDIPLDESYRDVRKHFKSDHEYQLDSLNDLGEVDKVVTRVTIWGTTRYSSGTNSVSYPHKGHCRWSLPKNNCIIIC